jgi:glycosyltransferase involved in cell wall biosynthesis
VIVKIAILITTFGTTGIEVTMQRLAHGLRRAGADIDVVVMSGGQRSTEPPMNADIRIVDLKAPRLWSSLPALVQYMRREQPTVLIAAGTLANGFAGLAKLLSRSTTPVILTEHGLTVLGLVAGGSLRRKVLRAVLARGYGAADAVVGVSQGVADELRKLPYLSPRRIHFIYNPVWSRHLVDGSLQDPHHPWLSEGSTIPVIVSVGRLDRLKGFDNLLRAFAIVRQKQVTRLIILGEGEERSALQLLASELKVSDTVDMPGFVDHPERFMSRAAVFALSSRSEGLGVVLIEALACGIPVVSTDCPTGPREILGDSAYGILVPVDDPSALAAAILAKLSDAGDRQSLRERAMEFSEEAAVQKYLALIDNIQSNA